MDISKIRNNTDKEIKYITFQWSCYNAVGDLIYDQIDGKSYVKIKFTGPLAAGETTGKKRNTTCFTTIPSVISSGMRLL